MPPSPTPNHSSTVRPHLLTLCSLGAVLGLFVAACSDRPQPPTPPTTAERQDYVESLSESLDSLEGDALTDTLVELTQLTCIREPDRAVELGLRAESRFGPDTPTTQRHALALSMCRALTNGGHLDDAESWLLRARDAAVSVADPDRDWQDLRATARLRTAQQRHGEALDASEEALRIAHGLDDFRREIQSGILRGRTLLDAGRHLDGLEVLLQTRNLADEGFAPGTIPPGIQADLSNDLGAAYDFLHCPELAVDHYRKTLEIWQGHRRLELVARQNIAAALHRMGRYDEALEMDVAALLLSQGLADRMSTAQLHLNTAIVLTDLGRVEDAVSHARTALELSDGIDTGDVRMKGEAGLGRIQFLRGQLDDADRLLESAFEQAHQAGDRELILSILPTMAQLAARRGDHEDAYDAMLLTASFGPVVDAHAHEHLIALHARFDALKREHDLEALSAEVAAERSARISAWSIAGLLAALALTVTLAWRFRLRAHRNLARAHAELATTHRELLDQTRMADEQRKELKVLQGLLPICCYCKKIRDEDGAWSQLERYIDEHSEARFTHSYCPECLPRVEAEVGGE